MREETQAAVPAETEWAAGLADVQTGKAERMRRQQGIRLGDLSAESQVEILAEERGERIAAEEIAAAIRKLHEPGSMKNDHLS